MADYQRRTLTFYSGGWNNKRKQPNTLTLTGYFKIVGQATNVVYEGMLDGFKVFLVTYSDMSGTLTGEKCAVPEKICKRNPYKHLKMENVSADLPLDQTVETSNDFLLNADFNERIYKLYFDFEMTGIHQDTTPISLGIVSDNGKSFYAEFTDYDRKQVDAWLEENVIAKTKWLSLEEKPWQAMGMTKSEHSVEVAGDRKTVIHYLKEWIKENFQTHYDIDGTLHNRIEFIGDCCAYDWMLLTELLGTWNKQEWKDGQSVFVDIANVPDIKKGMTKEEWLEKWRELQSNAQFIDIRRYRTGLPKYPDGINYIPTDICTIFKVRGIDPDINREEYAKPLLKNFEEPEQKHNALWDAKVIKCCYDRLHSDETGNALTIVGTLHNLRFENGRFYDSEGNEYELTFNQI